MKKKPYFTKYLPVEGEIKDGDWYRTINGNVYQSGNGVAAELREIVGKKRYNQHYQKVKLFLCSRDIQVGDKVQHISGAKGECAGIQPRGEGNRTTLYFREDKYPQHKMAMWLDEFFKVIGEISPDALSYVKEGQEFDEDEIRFWHKMELGLKNQGGFVIDPKIRPDWQEWVTDVQVKGPCGHFH